MPVTINGSSGITTPGIDNISVSPIFANGVTIGGAVTASNDSDGTFSSGTYTPSPVGGNIKSITNAGAFTFAAPTAEGSYTMIVDIANTTGAGAITFSGFAKVTGSTTTTSTHKFQIFIAKTISGVTANVVAMQ